MTQLTLDLPTDPVLLESLAAIQSLYDDEPYAYYGPARD